MDDKRLFLALWPDDRQRNTLRDTFRPLLSSVEGKMIDRRNWHVTLVFIGQFPHEQIPELRVKLAHVKVPPFRLRFDRLSYFPRPKIACLQAMKVHDELKQLKSDLEAILSPYDIAPEDLEYRPHITAARPARPFEAVRLARPLEMHWSGFELVESILLPGSIQYRPLKQ